MEWSMEYRCVATSVEGFVQQLAVAYVTHGYWFYVAGAIPEHKDPAEVDRRLIQRYAIAISKWARARRKRQGLANMQYLRHERWFVLLATKGRHGFFERERPVMRDIRRAPIKFGPYSVGCRKGRDGRWHASVRLHPDFYAGLKAHMTDSACRRSAAALAQDLNRLSVECYGPTRRQLLNILRAVNRARGCAGLELVEAMQVELRRRSVRPFSGERRMAGGPP